MITSITIKNIKAHRDTTVPLAQFTVLVGPNGSGKTTVLELLEAMALCSTGEAPSDVFDYERLVGLQRHRAPDHLEAVVTGHWRGREYQAELTCDPNPDAPWELLPSFAWRVGQQPQLGSGPAKIDAYRQVVSDSVFFHLNARIIAAPASSNQSAPRVEFDGRSLAAALKAIKLGHDEIWDQITTTLRQIVPNVRSIGVELVPAPKVDPAPSASASLVTPSGEWYRVFFNFDGARRVPASHASEGTLIALALVTILLGPGNAGPPRVILLDDMEQGLHPAAQMQLVESVKKLLAMESMRETQIIATTHSPYILDPLDYDQVRVFAIDGDGAAVVKSLADHPDAAKVRGSMSAGELWTSDQEASWVIGASEKTA